MYRNLDSEIFESFKEQLGNELQLFDASLKKLHEGNASIATVHEMFRFFHSLKANASYLKLEPFFELAFRAESVLSILREERALLAGCIIKWFEEISKLLYLWHEELDNAEALSPSHRDLIQRVRLSKPKQLPQEMLLETKALYIDFDLQRAAAHKAIFADLLQEVKHLDSISQAFAALLKGEYKIVIINLGKESFAFIEELQRLYPEVALVVIFDKLTSIITKRLLQNGVVHALENPLNKELLRGELHQVVKTFFGTSSLLMDHAKIYSFIQTLEPLSNTILQIMQICDDDEMGVKELTSVVKADPIITARILNTANSPLYANAGDMSSIERAVMRFGKNGVKTAALGGLYCSLGDLDLKAYRISEERFSKISMMRYEFIITLTHKKLAQKQSSSLATAAQLSNLGQILIAKELNETKGVDEFMTLSKSYGVRYAEEHMLATTTNSVSAQILRFWKLPKEIIDIIHFSDNPAEAPEELLLSALLNHLACEIFELDGSLNAKLCEEMKLMLRRAGYSHAEIMNAAKLTVERLK